MRENNIKMCLKEIVCEAVDLIRVFQVEANGGFFFVATVMSLWVALKAENFVTRWATISV